MVSPGGAEPASLMPGLDREGEAGLAGSGLGVGRGAGVDGLLEAAFGGVGLAALSGRLAARARGALPRARDGFFDDPLEELTPEFPDPADRVRRRSLRYDDGLGLDLRHPLGGRFADSLM